LHPMRLTNTIKRMEIRLIMIFMFISDIYFFISTYNVIKN
jgi:hypothetical protein